MSSIDFGNLAANFGKSGKVWDQGDFNYDGMVNSIDFGLLAENFGKSASGAAVALSQADWAALDPSRPPTGSWPMFLSRQRPACWPWASSACLLAVGGLCRVLDRYLLNLFFVLRGGLCQRRSASSLAEVSTAVCKTSTGTRNGPLR